VLGKQSVTTRDIDTHARVSAATVIDRFGSMRNALPCGRSCRRQQPEMVERRTPGDPERTVGADDAGAGAQTVHGGFSEVPDPGEPVDDGDPVRDVEVRRL